MAIADGMDRVRVGCDDFNSINAACNCLGGEAAVDNIMAKCSESVQ